MLMLLLRCDAAKPREPALGFAGQRGAVVPHHFDEHQLAQAREHRLSAGATRAGLCQRGAHQVLQQRAIFRGLLLHVDQAWQSLQQRPE